MAKLERAQAIAAARQTIQQEVETLQALQDLLGEQFWQAARPFRRMRLDSRRLQQNA